MQKLTFTEAVELFNKLLTEGGEQPMCEKEFGDWIARSDEFTHADIEGLAKDLLSDIQTEKCAAKDAWMYEH